MTSRVRIRSSRANGALSRGSNTAAGELRSAGHRCTHGFYSNRVVIKTNLSRNSSGSSRNTSPTSNRKTSPDSGGSAAIHTLETRLLNQALTVVDPDGILVCDTTEAPQSRLVAVWTTSVEITGSLDLARFEGTCHNQFHRAQARKFLPELLATGKPAPKTKNSNLEPTLRNPYEKATPAQSVTCSEKRAENPQSTAGENAVFSRENDPESTAASNILTNSAAPSIARRTSSGSFRTTGK
jgi:hypothetical protein